MPTHARGSFDVTMTPLPADGAAGNGAIGAMSLEKRYHGELEATARGRMLGVHTDVMSWSTRRRMWPPSSASVTRPGARRWAASLFTVLLLATSVAAGQSPSTSLRLVGLDGITRTLDLEALRALPQVPVVDSSPDSGVTRFRGPTLRTLVSLVGAPQGHDLRGPGLMLVVLAEARDGYKVAYSLGELDEQFGARPAIVALSENDHALSDQDGPLRVIVPGESHHARWIRQLTTLRVVRAGGEGKAIGFGPTERATPAK
jgi:hypothetical protein